VDTPTGITAGFSRPLFAVRSDEMYRLIQDLRSFEGAADCHAFGEYAHLTMQKHDEANSSPQAGRIRDFLVSKNHRNIEVKPVAATVEDCFIDLMTTTQNPKLKTQNL